MLHLEGYCALVLHAHLPFVRHLEHKTSLEERWLFEAITECYLPLLAAFDRLRRDGIPFELTINLTPPLLAMLSAGIFDSRATWFLCPMLNPSGHLRGTRENHEGRDLNRDYKDVLSAEISAHIG